jgi:PAS domain S-box-containing protein
MPNRKMVMANYQKMTKAELIRLVVELGGAADAEAHGDGERDGGPVALVKETRDDEKVQDYQLELETQNRELMETHQQLEETLKRYADLYDFAPVGYVTFDGNGLIHEINLTGAGMLGTERTRLVGMPFVHYVAREHLRGFRSHLRRCKEGHWHTSTELAIAGRGMPQLQVHLDSIPVHHSSGATHYRTTIADISERKRIEAQLLQAQKMELVGRLAGGVAHDFNNILMVIIAYSDLLRSSAEDDYRRNLCEQVLQASRRAAGLVRQLLAFGRKQVFQSAPLDLNTVIRDLFLMLSRLIREDIEMVTELADGVLPIAADPNQIGQVVTNLVVNARDAMADGGRLVIRTAAVDLDEATAERIPGGRPGRFVQLEVADSGCGMGPQVMSHLFEPYFTTKEVGQGTGLGLATVHGIITQSGGFVGVASALGQGSTFSCYLPRSHEPAPASAGQPPRSAARAQATILVVDDDPAIRRELVDRLESAGHQVLVADSGEMALAAARAHPHGIDLLITATLRSGMDGATLAAYLAAEQPELRVIRIARPGEPLPDLPPGAMALGSSEIGAGLLTAVASALGQRAPAKALG